MIVDKNTSPGKDLYFLGAKTIEILDKERTTEYDYFHLFRELSETQEISIKLFGLVLDWLFILGVISNGKNGMVHKCF